MCVCVREREKESERERAREREEENKRAYLNVRVQKRSRGALKSRSSSLVKVEQRPESVPRRLQIQVREFWLQKQERNLFQKKATFLISFVESSSCFFSYRSRRSKFLMTH